MHTSPRARWRAVLATLAVVTVAGLLAGTVRVAFAATLFSDDFEDGNTSGWSKSGGTWSIVSDGSRALQQSKADTDNARLFAGQASWTDYRLQARVKPLSLPSTGTVSLLARSTGSTTFYRLVLAAGNQVRLESVQSGAVAVLSSASRTIATGTWYTLAIEVTGTTLRGSVDGAQVVAGTATSVAAGRIGLQTITATAEFDDVVVTSGGTAPPSPTPTSASASPSASPSASASPSGSTSPPPAGHSSVVAKDGSGNHTSIQAAVNAVPAGNTSRYTISVKPGTYKELVSIPSNKPLISLIGLGAGPGDVVIAYDNASGTPKPDGGTYGTSGSASVTIDGNDFMARNLTFANTFDEAAHSYSAEQAVAVLTRADRLVFDRVRFLGNQDTLYHNSAAAGTVGRAYFRDCYVEGDVDFIFGRGTGVFDRCEIRSLNRGSSSNNGYVTAASTMNTTPYGLLFTQCTLTSDGAAAKSVHLGRPWHPSGDVNAIGQVLFRDSVLGAHIKDAPWTDMSGFSWKDARFSEYRNSGAGATVTADRPQLTDAQAATYTPQRYLAGGDGWNPLF
jgi:pectin methylesterase-like acyl-CoA thioesterase